MREEKKIHFDLDGVLADFDTAYTQLTGATYRQNPNMTKEEEDKKWSLLESHPNFFRDLPWVPGSRAMLAFTMKHSSCAVGILSAASHRIPQSPAQKEEWCKREIPWMAASAVIIVHRKQDKIKYVGDGNILVDDYKPNIDQWKEVGGTGIHFKDAVQAMTELQEIFQAPDSMFKRMLHIIKQETSFQ